MTGRAALILLGSLGGIAVARGDQTTADKAEGRVLAGTIVASGRKPVEGARVLFCRRDMGLAFVEGATATTDALGRFRADLTKFPWSTGAMRAMVLAPGFEAADRTIPAGAEAVTADFEMTARAWKETQVRLEHTSGRPVPGVEVSCSVGGVKWERLETDAGGCCRLAMIPDMPIRLYAEPHGARPIDAYFQVMTDGPGSITMPVLPPYRGRVLGPDGRPMPDVAVGRSIAFGSDGVGEMLPPFWGGQSVVTDREGRFEIAPTLMIRGYVTRPGPPKLEALCFADASFRQVAYRVLDPTREVGPMEVTLRRARRVRLPVAPGSVAATSKAILSATIAILPRRDVPDWLFSLMTRQRDWKGTPAGTVSGDVIEEAIPEGTYQLSVELRDAESGKLLGEAERELVVPGGEGTLDLPPLELQVPEFRQMVGKPAPEIEATDLDTGQPVRLADLRGKVIVLDFWGYWCGPCVWNMPHLAELQGAFAGRPLVILALHDQSVQSRADYDRKIAMARRRAWGGRDLPLRILLDRPDPEKADDRAAEGTGTTVKRYGIRGFPTLFVIDRDGTLVEEVSVARPERLDPLVRRLVEKAEAH